MNKEEAVNLITKIVVNKIENIKKYCVPVGISNRHVHLSNEDLQSLFGENYKLTKKMDLKQPGQFAANETVTIRGPKGQFEKVRILGPVRNESQVEISMTDSFRLGVRAPIKESGNLENTPGIEIEGPEGIIRLKQGTIIALRHVHMTPDYAEKLGFKDKDVIEVKTVGEREGVLGNVLVRVSQKSALEMHIDVDEANACALKNNDIVVLHKK